MFALQHKQSKHWVHADGSLTVMKSNARVFETAADATEVGLLWIRADRGESNMIVHEVLTTPKISRAVRTIAIL